MTTDPTTLRTALEAAVLEHTGCRVDGVVIRHVRCAVCAYFTAALATPPATEERPEVMGYNLRREQMRGWSEDPDVEAVIRDMAAKASIPVVDTERHVESIVRVYRTPPAPEERCAECTKGRSHWVHGSDVKFNAGHSFRAESTPPAPEPSAALGLCQWTPTAEPCLGDPDDWRHRRCLPEGDPCPDPCPAMPGCHPYTPVAAARAEGLDGLVDVLREEHRPVAYHWSQSGESGTVCAASVTGLHSRVTRWPCSVESAIVAAQDRAAARAEGLDGPWAILRHGTYCDVAVSADPRSEGCTCGLADAYLAARARRTGEGS